jgi:hypothetical protein
MLRFGRTRHRQSGPSLTSLQEQRHQLEFAKRACLVGREGASHSAPKRSNDRLVVLGSSSDRHTSPLKCQTAVKRPLGRVSGVAGSAFFPAWRRVARRQARFKIRSPKGCSGSNPEGATASVRLGSTTVVGCTVGFRRPRTTWKACGGPSTVNASFRAHRSPRASSQPLGSNGFLQSNPLRC